MTCTRTSPAGRGRRRLHLALVNILFSATRLIAQTPDARLSVRPHDMATGTQNPAAGEYPLDSVPGVLVSVPPQCAGAHRCPLFVFLPGAGSPAKEITAWLRPVADKYGMILLAPTRYGTPTIDAALKETLQRFAIDPDKIAIIGRCASGPSGAQYGVENLDIFSRIALISGGVPSAGRLKGQPAAVEFLIDAGFLESRSAFKNVPALRQAGQRVKHVVSLRGHEHQVEDYDFLGRWLQESWATPDPGARAAPADVADPLPLLTPRILMRITAFWTSFAQLPDSIRVTARRAHLREVVVPVGPERVSVFMANIPALAARYPSVATALKKAGLTAERHDAYRVALLSALLSKTYEHEVGDVEPSSALAKNMAFFDAQQDAFAALERAGMARPDKVIRFNGMADVTYPADAEEIGPMGIWRTP